MADVLTPQRISERLGRLSRELDALVDMLESAELDAAHKRAAADLAESKAFVNADGPMDMRKHLARIAAGDAESDALVAEALVRVLRQKIRAKQVSVEVGRSMNAALRAELETLTHQGSGR